MKTVHKVLIWKVVRCACDIFASLLFMCVVVSHISDTFVYRLGSNLQRSKHFYHIDN